MNRKSRRSAAKHDKTRNASVGSSGLPLVAPILAKPNEIGFGLRVAAKILLSTWILRRVSHPQLLLTLADLARQSGRMDAVLQIQEKLRGAPE